VRGYIIIRKSEGLSRPAKGRGKVLTKEEEKLNTTEKRGGKCEVKDQSMKKMESLRREETLIESHQRAVQSEKNRA